MNQRVLEPVGATLSDISLGNVDSQMADELRTVLASHGVIIIQNQFVDDKVFTAFLRSFGNLTFTKGETPVAGFDDLNVVSNVGRDRPPRSVWHVDTSYVARPPAYTALRAVEIPSEGGETLFTNQYRAYETLSQDLRERLKGRTVRHVVSGLSLDSDDETVAEHPVFRKHPISGRTALYLSTPERCKAVSGLPDDEAMELITYLFEHSTQEENFYRHAWSPGDVVMWDNACVLHRGDHSRVVGNRVMHRGMVAGEVPVSA